MAKRKRKVTNDLHFVFGNEPAFNAGKITSENYNSVLTPLLQWYGQYGGAPTSKALRTYHKTWLKDFALANGFKKGSFSIPNQGISTAGAVARLAMKGFPLKKEHVDRLKAQIKEWLPEKKAGIDYKKNAKLMTLRAKIKNEQAVTPFYTAFDTAIDEVVRGAKEWDVNVGLELNAGQAGDMTAYYKDSKKEIQKAYDKKDAELVEAYDFPRLVLRRLLRVHDDILAEISNAQARGKVVRKAKTIRRKKVKPASALVRSLKYLPVHAGYSLTSIDPEKVVGASTVYVFDTKKRHLKKYTSGVSGIEVSGTTLKNITGVVKTIRKPEEQLSGFGSLPRTKAEKLFNDVRAKEKPTSGRLNADCVILSAF